MTISDLITYTIKSKYSTEFTFYKNENDLYLFYIQKGNKWNYRVSLNFPEYMRRQVRDGYIRLDGSPLKCQFCDHDILESCNERHMDYNLCEYDMRCEKCKKIVGSWAYGTWLV